MSARLHSFSDLSGLFGEPDAMARATKKDAQAEAQARPIGSVMLDVAQRDARAKTGSNIRSDQHHETHPGQGRPASRFLREGFIRLTATEAGAILAECRYERQDRDLKLGGKNQIMTLADIMSRGQWRAKDQLDFGYLAGILILLNGHHRLAAQAMSGQTIEWSIVIHPCADTHDIERLFYSFDTNVRIRSNQNILAAANAVELLGLKHTTVEALYRAGPIISTNFDFSRAAKDPRVSRIVDRRMEVMKSFQAEGGAWERACKPARVMVKKRLLNQGAFAVAMLCFRYQPEAAGTFFGGIAENDGLKKGDPRHTFLAALQAHNSAGTSQYTARQIMAPWNAWFEGRKLSYIRVENDGPFRIAGTPVGR